MIGKTICHYKILEKLGEGGMGVVYKAEDTKLDRTIALKFLTQQALGSDEEKARFVHEAKAAAALSHPNICTVHEIDESEGHTFIAMECVDGQSLKDRIDSGPLKLDEAVDIAIQVAEGLQEAHEKGIVHRDIKPANVMVTSKGQAKIMDFGLAKIPGRTKLTKTGMTLGTAAYMSPEQARGGEIDHRTDIWSLGVVLYEMISGRLPFGAEYEQALMYSILNEKAEPLTGLRTGVPMELEQLVDKCMEKNPTERYQTAGDLLADFRRLKRIMGESRVESGRVAQPSKVRSKVVAVSMGGLAALFVVSLGLNMGGLRDRMLDLTGRDESTAIESLAIMPFVNLGSDPDTDWLSEEIPASIINNISRISHLRVVPRSSSFQFKDRQDELKAIGNKLDVKAILIGQVSVRGDRLNIRAELVDVDEDRQLWGDRYASTLNDIVSVEQDIVVKISDALRLQLTGDEQSQLAIGYTDNPRAHRLYLKGRYYWNKRTKDDFYRAIDHFERAIDEEPDYALAYGGLAETYALFVDYRIMEPKEAYPKAKAAAYKAIAIDNKRPEPYTALGYVLTFGDWDWAGAEKQYRRAIELSPNYANAHHWYALLLYILGRNDEALKEIEKAQEIDPLSLIMKSTKANVLYYARRYDEAIDECREALEMDPNYVPVLHSLGATYCQLQMYDEAVTIYEKLGVSFLPSLAATYALAGMEVEAEDVLDELARLRESEHAFSSTTIAMAYLVLGDKDIAYENLELAYETRSFGLPLIVTDPAWDPWRDDPRFISIVRRLGLEATLVPAR